SAGCDFFAKSKPGPDNPADKPHPQGDKTADHGHKAGTHGGVIVEIGRDSYHAEPVFEKNGLLRLYLLGKDEARVEEVEAQTLTAYAQPEDAGEAMDFTLKPVPQPDDAPGKTSVFVGTLPKEAWGRRVEIIVTSIRIKGDRFRFS